MTIIQDHLIALAPKQRSQLAFLLQHLQGAMAAGRSPGELADAFGSVLVSQGSKNKNDPKEMLEKLLSLEVTFVRDLLDASKVKNVLLDLMLKFLTLEYRPRSVVQHYAWTRWNSAI